MHNSIAVEKKERTKTYHVTPRQVDSGSQKALILNDLNTGTGVEHNNDLALIQNICRRVNGDTWKVLELERRPIEVNSATVGEDVKTITPLSVRWPESNFYRSRIVSSG